MPDPVALDDLESLSFLLDDYRRGGPPRDQVQTAAADVVAQAAMRLVDGARDGSACA